MFGPGSIIGNDGFGQMSVGKGPGPDFVVWHKEHDFRLRYHIRSVETRSTA